MIKVPLKHLLNIASFNMENAYFQNNEEIIKQIFGIPQGKSLSHITGTLCTC